MSEQKTAAELAARLRSITADLEGYILRRACEIADPRIAAAEQAAAVTVAKVSGDLSREVQRQKDLVDELRRQADVMERRYYRALSTLNASGFSGYHRPGIDVDGEPPPTEPAAQILHWLDLAIPPWPEDQELIASGQCVRAPFKAGRTAVDFEVHPSPWSRGIPLGALIRALQAAARYDPAGTATDVIITIRDVLVGHELPPIAESAHRHDVVMDELDQPG